MRFKQKVALLLTSIMMFGAVGVTNPTEVRAAGETNTFTLTVPADTNITAVGWNNIGSVGVSNVSIASGKKIAISIDNGATGRTLKKTGDASKTVGYEIKKGTSASNEAFGDSLVFTANGTQSLGAVVADFSSAEEGTYEDTINFTAELKSDAYCFRFESLIAEYASIIENTIVLNTGDTWENAIESNAGNIIKVNLLLDPEYGPMEFELKLGKYTINDVERIVLGAEMEDEGSSRFEPVFLITNGHFSDESGQGWNAVYKPTDTIPEEAYLMISAG